MKKIIFTAIFVVMAVFMANAQNYKWFAGGQFSLWSGEDESSYIAIAPEAGYQLTDKFTVAASVKYYHNKGEDGFAIAPYVRYSAIKKGILTGFVDGTAEFGVDGLEGVKLGLKPGIALSITDRLACVIHYGFIGYSDGTGSMINYNNGTGVGIDLSGYQSSLGFYYSF